MTEQLKCQDVSCSKPRWHDGYAKTCDVPLTVAEVVKRLPTYTDASDWRSRVAKGTAPHADDADDDDPQRDIKRRMPRWNGSTIDAYVETRKFIQWRRTSPTYVVVPLHCGDLRQRWAVAVYRSGQIYARYDSEAAARDAANRINEESKLTTSEKGH
jgi:hypothetical protein